MTQVFRAALVAAAVAAIGLSGCQKDAAKPDTAAIIIALKNQEAEWNGEYKAKDVAKIIGHYTSDAVLMSPGQPSAGTPTAIKAAITAMTADPALALTFEADKVGVSPDGTMAYTRGHFSMTATDPATKQVGTQTGSYVTIYQKQADASWKAVEDIITPGAAPPPPPTAPAAMPPPKAG